MVKKNACIFISGTGTNLNALVKNSRITVFPINIKLVVSNKKNARGLLLAKKYSIPYRIIDTKDSLFEIKILNEIKQKKISIICLAGYMKVLSKNFIKNFKGKILNIHPSLLPKYKGLNTFSKILQNQEILSGCTVHYVNEKLDSGKIILQKKFTVLKSDSVNTLKNKTQKIEYLAYSEAITKIYKMN
jgi:phosphoribosylglycinamide formyltransferase-1|tara:strand:+ start:206 stop:769 length:564 start_codon:yes stop_codon:yes gene_type:complete